MNLKIAFLKLAVRAKRRKEVWKDPVGERFFVPRAGKKPVDVLLYRPKTEEGPWPVLFNIHGGAWVGCDASQMDSYCVDMAEKCGAFIVNINYTKLDIQPFPYPQEEIRDTVLYFREHAEEYGLDREKFALIGYSAGGHLAAAGTLMLHDMGVDVSAQVLCYPFLSFSGFDGLLSNGDSRAVEELFFPEGVRRDDPYISPAAASDEQLQGLAHTVFICCGADPLTAQAKAYQEMLARNGVPVVWKLYEDALHGFLEVNHKEYPAQDGKNPQQATLARAAEDEIAKELKERWQKNEKRGNIKL